MSALIALAWLVFAGGGPEMKTYSDVVTDLLRTWPFFLLGWLLLQLRNAFDAIAALIRQRSNSALEPTARD